MLTTSTACTTVLGSRIRNGDAGVEQAGRRVGEERLAAALVRIPQQAAAAADKTAGQVQLDRQKVDIDVVADGGDLAMQLAEDEVRGRADADERGGYQRANVRQGFSDVEAADPYVSVLVVDEIRRAIEVLRRCDARGAALGRVRAVWGRLYVLNLP
jgi:hypothetical protein